MGMYPEVLQMDITFSLNIHGYNTIHIVCVDLYMRSHTLSFGMLSDRLEESIQVFVDFFAEQMGDNLDKVEFALLDKEAAEHKSIKNAIPNARILLCNFHPISVASKRFPRNERPDEAMDAFCGCLFSKSKEEFSRHCAKLLSVG